MKQKNCNNKTLRGDFSFSISGCNLYELKNWPKLMGTSVKESLLCVCVESSCFHLVTATSPLMVRVLRLGK